MRVQGSQIFKQNWIISIRSRVIVVLPIWVSLALGGGAGGWGVSGWSATVYMSSGMFRGKESSNRIELSRLVQDLFNFGVLGYLWLWGWGGGWMGVGVVGEYLPHMCTCMHMHTRTCTCGKHDNFMQMTAPIGGIPGNSLWYHMHMHACACICVHVHMGGVHPLTTPTPQRGDPRNHSKFNSTWTNRDISILFEDLKSVETPPPMGGCIIWWVGGWVGWWMGSGQITKNLKIVDWIKIIRFCLKIYDL